MECLGGNGYVEEGGEGVMARIYREMPLNSIWEGAGNIMALDLLRALRNGRRGRRARRTSWRRRAARMPALDRLADALPARVDGDGRRDRGAPPGAATWRWRCRPRCCAQHAQRRGVRRLLRLAPRRRLGPTPSARCAAGLPTSTAIIARAMPAERPHMNNADLILHHYAGSPFSEKVRLVLGFKRLAWRR